MYLGTHAGSWCINEGAERPMQYKHENQCPEMSSDKILVPYPVGTNFSGY